MHHTRLDHSQILLRDVNNYNLNVTLPVSKELSKQNLRETQAEINKIVADSCQQRDQGRDARIIELDQSSRKASLTERKRVSEKIKASQERGQSQGMTCIEIPQPPSADPKTCMEWQTIDILSEIVDHLQRRNRQHFGKAQGSPFTIDLLANEMSLCGDSSLADSVLEGTHQTDRNSESMTLLIQH